MHVPPGFPQVRAFRDRATVRRSVCLRGLMEITSPARTGGAPIELARRERRGGFARTKPEGMSEVVESQSAVAADRDDGAAASRSPSPRVASVDTIRGLTIALMVLVNDAQEAPAAPAFLKHVPPGVNGMSPADVVFPAFLFVVGMSVPLALERALTTGASRGAVLRKVIWRAVALLTMGVFMVGRAENTGWNPSLWTGAMYVCFFLTWSVIPKDGGLLRSALIAGRFVGIGGLMALALVYRGPDGERLVLGPLFDGGGDAWLRHEWWGILGAIGWAYLATSLAYLGARARPALLLLGVPLGVALYALESAGVFAGSADGTWLGTAHPALVALGDVVAWVHSHVSLGRHLGVYAALSIAGCVLGARLLGDGTEGGDGARLSWGVGIAIAFGLSGLALEPFFGVSKPAATPSWALYSGAITAGTWALVHWVMDVRGWQRWARWLRPAGANPLTAYILHPLIRGALAAIPGLGLLQLYKEPGQPAAVAVAGAVLMTLFVVWVTGRVAHHGLRLKV